jgi:hypothetical protein
MNMPGFTVELSCRTTGVHYKAAVADVARAATGVVPKGVALLTVPSTRMRGDVSTILLTVRGAATGRLVPSSAASTAPYSCGRTG